MLPCSSELWASRIVFDVYTWWCGSVWYIVVLCTLCMRLRTYVLCMQLLLPVLSLTCSCARRAFHSGVAKFIGQIPAQKLKICLLPSICSEVLISGCAHARCSVGAGTGGGAVRQAEVYGSPLGAHGLDATYAATCHRSQPRYIVTSRTRVTHL